MKLHQLRYVWEVARHDLNVTATATDLYTSQPGISKQIRLLEDELGVEIFARSGKHLSRITAAGRIILEKAGRILQEVESIKAVGEEYRNETRGTLSVATTYTQARYALPSVLMALRDRYPDVSLHMRQGNTEQIGQMASSGLVDFAIAPEVMDGYRELVMMPCYRWNRCVVVPRDHPLAEREQLALEDIEAHPVVTYDAGFPERLPVAGDVVDEDGGLNIALSAVDTDVIKTYVRLGFGIGIIAAMAYDTDADADLVAIDAANLFRASTVYIGCRRGTFMRQFMIDFVGLFAPHLTAVLIDEAFAAPTPAARAALFRDIELPRR